MTRFNIAARIKEEEAFKNDQKRLKEKHKIDQDNIVVVEKANIYKFTIKTFIGLVRLLATIIILALAVIGLATLVYPEIRNEFLIILQDVLLQIKNSFGI